MENLSTRQLVLMILGVVLLSALWVTRYEIVPSGANRAYQMDRWTGNVQWITGGTYRDVKPQKRKVASTTTRTPTPTRGRTTNPESTPQKASRAISWMSILEGREPTAEEREEMKRRGLITPEDQKLIPGHDYLADFGIALTPDDDDE